MINPETQETQLLLGILDSFPKELVKMVVEYMKVFKGKFSGFVKKSSEKLVQSPASIVFDGERIFISKVWKRQVEILNYDGELTSFLEGKSIAHFMDIYGPHIFVGQDTLIQAFTLSDLKLSYTIYTERPIIEFTFYESKIYSCFQHSKYITIFSTEERRYVEKIGAEGNEEEKLQNPTSITINKDFLYVIDGKRIVLYDKNGKYHTSWDTNKICNSIHLPKYIRTKGDFICFLYDTTICCLNKHGEHVQSININDSTALENDDYLSGMTIYNDKIYVCDCSNNRVIIFE